MTMTRDNLLAEITEFFKEKGWGRRKEQITEKDLLKELDIDSVDLLDIMDWIEARFGVVCTRAFFAKTETVKDVIDYILNTEQTEQAADAQ